MPPRIPIPEGAEPGEIIHVMGKPSKHMQRSLRIKVGEQVILCDGEREYVGTVSKATVAGVEVRVDEIRMPDTESPLKLILVQAAIKVPKMDFIIEKATEMGVSDIIVFKSARSGANSGAVISRRSRWENIIGAATAQSGRVIYTNLDICRGMDHAFETVNEIMGEYKIKDGQGIKVLFWEEKTDFPIPKRKEALKSACVMVGPEGGWTNEEVEKACDEGFEIAGLGPRTLRAETAAIVSVSLIQSAFGDLPKPG